LGNIYVSDSKNGRVQVFDKYGILIKAIFGTANKKFISPRGIAYDPTNDVLIVTDFDLHKLFTLKLKINQNAIIVKYGNIHNELNLLRPQAISFFKGMIAIADSRNYKIKIYNLENCKIDHVFTIEKDYVLYPGGVCFASDKVVYTTDIDRGSVLRFTKID
ncbi:MAG: hypothetical protein MHPSP_001497, partial [Paramarteilia canceri]